MEKERTMLDLRGNTLRVYLYTLKNRRVGVREVQRSLHFSNSSLAQYHLNKLKESGLVREIGGQYEVMNEVKVDVMRDFLRVGTLIVPRFVFYAVFFTVLTLYVGSITIKTYDSVSLADWTVGLLTLASAIFWYEALKAWRSAPV